MLSKTIATAYLRARPDLQGRSMRTTPGRAISFSGGAARVTDERDLPFVLALDGVQVELNSEYLDFWGDYKARCPAIRARVVVADDPDDVLWPPGEAPTLVGAAEAEGDDWLPVPPKATAETRVVLANKGRGKPSSVDD